MRETPILLRLVHGLILKLPAEGSYSEKHSVQDTREEPLTANIRRLSNADFLREIKRTAAIAYPHSSARQRYHRFKYAVRSLALFESSKTWLEMLAGAKFKPLLTHSPRLYLKLQRPLLINGLTARQKLQFLQEHYRFLFQNFPAPKLQRLCCTEGLEICRFNPRNDSVFRLSLHASVHEKEGEMTLVLEDVLRKSDIKRLTFSITSWSKEGGEMIIGGLQGARSESGRQLVVETTRACFGLRPKGLLLFALQQLANEWNIAQIKAVGNLQHVCNQMLKKIGSRSDFDTFWTESGARPAPDGMFLLPLIPQQKDLSDLNPSKRSMYRKRYTMLNLIAKDVRASTAH